jgi:hypothetical protein
VAINPFKDRFGKVISCSSPGVSVSVPSFERIEPRIVGATTASEMPQSFLFRQGVSIRTANQFIRTVIRPVIYAGDVTETDKNTTANDLHEFRVNDFGDPELFDGIGPFKDYGKLAAKDLINDPDVPDYPQVFFNPSINSPALMDGVIEPLTIRDSMLNGLESPFSARRMRAELMDGNIDPDPSYGSTRIVQFFPLTASAQVDPYIDSIETRLATPTGSTIHRLVVPGIISELKRLDTPFDDARPVPWKMTVTHTASTSERGLIDYLKKSAGAGFTYMNNREGTDSIVYGGDFRSGSLGSANSFELNSGFISFVPPRIVLRNRDNVTGSYPTVGRTTGRTLTLGNYKTHFNDDNTMIFRSDTNVSYPSVIQSGSTRFLPDYTSSLEATATVRKGVSDQLFEMPVSGVNITPFDESRVNLQTSSFYATGTLRSVLPGFGDPLSAKTQIVIDIYNSENCDVYIATASSANWRTPYQGRLTNGIGSGLAYYNFSGSKWEMHHHPDVITGSHANFNSPDPKTATGSMQAVSIAQDVESADLAGASFADVVQRVGRIAGHAGFPFDQKFNATGSQLLDMSNYIQHPFVVEKLVYEFSASWGAEEQTQGKGVYRAGRPFFSTFAVIRQSRKGIYEIITSSLRTSASMDPQNSLNPNNLHDTSFIATRRREVVSFGDVAWSTSFVPTASYFYDQDKEKAFPELVRDITLITGFEIPTGLASSAAVGAYLTGTYKMEFDARAPVLAKDLGFPFGYNGGPNSIYASAVINDSGSTIAGAKSAYLQHNQGGGRTGTAAYGTFMGDGRSPSGGVAAAQLSGSSNIALQGLETVIQPIISGNYKEPSPYILMPEDSICLTWINQNMSGNMGYHPSINMRLPVGRGKLTLYGSLIRNDVGVQDNINQLLTSDVVREDIKEIVVDQFITEGREEYFKSYLDNYVTGSITGSDPGSWRAVVGSFVSGTARSPLDSGIVGAPVPQMSGAFQRFVRMTDPDERYFDTLLPDLITYGIRAGAVTAEKGKLFPRSAEFGNQKGTTLWWGATPEGETDTGEPLFYREASNHRMPFPYLHGQNRLDQQNGVYISAQPSSASSAGVNERIVPQSHAAKILFSVGWDIYDLDSQGNQFKMDHANTGSARGYRYGILDTEKLHSTIVFRGDRYGQFRDMLEQRLSAKYYTSKETQPSPVKISFVRAGTTTAVSPLNTTSQNLSNEFTSSLPYFDGFAVDRPDDPLESEATTIALGV